jgi:hypothetical protein
MVILKIVFVLVLLDASSCWADQDLSSADITLTSLGWVVHSSSDFKHISRQVLAKFSEERADRVYDTRFVIYCSICYRLVNFESYDSLSTPRDEMYGDIVFITDPVSDELIGLRWYDGQTNHVVFDDGRQCCVTDRIPRAKNCLF